MDGLVAHYRSMLVIRRFEERCVELKADGSIQGSVHLCIGQEGIPVGACRALEPRDALTATYRGHGWAIARGLALVDLFGELLGRDSPLCGGRGGSAYLSSKYHGFLGENSIVGAGVPIALGAAVAARYDGEGSVSLVSIGDGALNQGATHEALNFAAAFSLPLVVVVENNRYSELTPIASMVKIHPLSERAVGYAMPGFTVDGNDVDEVESAVRRAVDRARGGEGPSMIEALTQRLVGHYVGDPQHYRPPGELDAAQEDEPLARLRREADRRGLTGDLDRVERDVSTLIDEALTKARAFPLPDPATVREHVYA